jgi:hypothetical protein
LIARILLAGTAGAIASAVAAALASRLENRHAARPINAIAHIYDGGAPPAHDGQGSRNTALGFAIHTAASLWWATFYEFALKLQSPPRKLLTGSGIAAIAYVVDYYVVSTRFRPGFEEYLSPRGMFAVYAALAAGFALSSRNGRALVGKRQDQGERAAFPGHAREPELAAEEARQLAADR